MVEGLPPSYADIDIGVEADSTLVTKVQEELLSYLRTTARGTIEADILLLRDIITAIENDFAALLHEMTILDEKNLVSDKFAPKWKVLHDEYTVLMQKSQTTASSVSDKIDDLVKDHLIVLQDKKVPSDVKKGIVKEYIKKLEPFQPEAEKNSMRFLRLSQHVLAFKMSLRKKVESGRQGLDDKFETIDRQIEELELKLKKLSNVMTKSWKALKSIFPMENKGDHNGIVAIKSLADMAPTVGKEMMKIALKYLDSQLAADLEKLQKKVDELSTRKMLASLKFVREQRGAIDESCSTTLLKLVVLEPQFNGISEKMGAIQGIWKMLLTDSQTLLGKLESMSKTEYDVSFDRFSQRLAATYEALQFSLKQYALAVPKLPGAVVSSPELPASVVPQSVDENLLRETVVAKSSNNHQDLDSGSRSDSHPVSGQVNRPASTSNAKEGTIPEAAYLTTLQNRAYMSLLARSGGYDQKTMVVQKASPALSPQTFANQKTMTGTVESGGRDEAETIVVQKEPPTAQILTKSTTINPETTLSFAQSDGRTQGAATGIPSRPEYPIAKYFRKSETTDTESETTPVIAQSGSSSQLAVNVIRNVQAATGPATSAHIAADGGRRKKKKKRGHLFQVPNAVKTQSPPENKRPGV